MARARTGGRGLGRSPGAERSVRSAELLCVRLPESGPSRLSGSLQLHLSLAVWARPCLRSPGLRGALPPARAHQPAQPGHGCRYHKAGGSHSLVRLEHFVFRFFLPGGQISQISPNCSQTSCSGAAEPAAWEEACSSQPSSGCAPGWAFRPGSVTSRLCFRRSLQCRAPSIRQ